MDEKQRIDRVIVTMPVRVRGMSTQTKFFDETVEASLVSPQAVVIQLRNLVDLETEVHLMNLQNHVGGTFRVTWVNTQAKDGWHNVGLELIEGEGDLWEMSFPAVEAGEEGAAAQAWLACQRCGQRLLTSIPEVEAAFLCDGFLIARACDRCKATTPWEFRTGPEQADSASAPAEGESNLSESEKILHKLGKDLRRKGRAPLQMQIKVLRQKYGTVLEDICETVNVSGNGAYFLSRQNYDVGELIEVVLPYEEGALTIPVPARVVRRDEPPGSYLHAVAIQLESEKE